MGKMETERNFGNLSDAEELHSDREKALSLISEKTEYLSTKYGIEKDEIFDEIEKRNNSIPLSALSFGIAPLEAIVSYLKDAKGISIKEISKKLGRSYKTIWATYSNSKKGRSKRKNNKNSLLGAISGLKPRGFTLLAESRIFGIKNCRTKVRGITPTIFNKKNLKEIMIPISAFSNSNLGIFESAVKFLKEECKMRYSEIAEITGRNQRTIWTSYRKAKEKE